MDAATADLLRASLRHVLTVDDAPPVAARLDDLGWPEVVASDRAGALQLLFEVYGATRSPAPVLAAVLGERLAELLGDPAARRAVLALGPSLDLEALHCAGSDPVAVDSVALADPGPDGLVAVPVFDAALRSGVALVAAGAATRAPVAGMDPTVGLCRVAVVVDPGRVRWIGADDGALLDELAAEGRRALASALVALAAEALREVTRYAGDRVQYGRPIGSFQAVQHGLADAHAAVVGAAGLVAEAWADGSPWAATVAKAAAGRAAERATRQCQQTYGAIGFTWEHPFPHVLRRAFVLDALLGDWRTLQARVGATLLERRTVPRLGQL